MNTTATNTIVEAWADAEKVRAEGQYRYWLGQDVAR